MFTKRASIISESAQKGPFSKLVFIRKNIIWIYNFELTIFLFKFHTVSEQKKVKKTIDSFPIIQYLKQDTNDTGSDVPFLNTYVKSLSNDSTPLVQ